MTASHPSSVPSLLFATSTGEILDYGGLHMAGSAAGRFYKPRLHELIELPAGSELFALPGRLPVGIEPEGDEPALLDADPFHPDQPIQAVAAFMASLDGTHAGQDFSQVKRLRDVVVGTDLKADDTVHSVALA